MEYQIKLYWELSDQELESVYVFSQCEDILADLPFDGGLSAINFALFARRVEVFGVAYDLDLNPQAFFFLTNFEGTTARFHLRTFLELASLAQTQLLSKWIGDWCFQHFEFKSLTLLLPATGVKGRSLGSDMGARLLGEIPGACWQKELKKTVPGELFVVVPQSGALGVW